MLYNQALVIVVMGMGAIAASAHAAVAEFTNKAAWQSAIGPHTNITFQGFPQNTLITTQYSHLGVVFSDGTDRILYNDSLINDGVGLRSSDLIYGTITLQFAQPVTAVASEFLGNIDILLYQNGQLVFDSSDFSISQSRFGGVISTEAFDKAVIRDPVDGSVNIDDLYFGPPVPGPGVLGLLGVALLIPRRRRPA